MKRISSLLLAITGLFWGLAPAHAAFFRAETSANTIAIYSTSDKPLRCVLSVEFFFTRKETLRSIGKTACLKRDAIPAGKHVKVCEFSHPRLVDPVVAGPVVVSECEPEPQ